MDFTKSATDGLLRVVGALHPEYAPLIRFLTDHESQLLAAAPLIQIAATEGPGAFAAAEKAAPELAAAIKKFIAASPISDGPTAQKMHTERLTRQIVGAPALSPDQERKWLNPISDDSRSGSG
jgi:hypothetical protein